MTYKTTPKQEQAIRDWLQEAIVPLIEQVLVKKLGQAMSFAAEQVVEPKRKPLTDEEIWDEVKAADLDWQTGWSLDEDAANRYIIFARAIEAAHGIGEQK